MENEIELPQPEDTYQVAGVFGAENEPTKRWIAVGNALHSRKAVNEELTYWRETFPNRRWAILISHTTLEVEENE